jgi:hypothetical protein
VFIIPTTQEVEIGGSQYNLDPDKSRRPYMKDKLKAKGLGHELSICLANFVGSLRDT